MQSDFSFNRLTLSVRAIRKHGPLHNRKQHSAKSRQIVRGKFEWNTGDAMRATRNMALLRKLICRFILLAILFTFAAIYLAEWLSALHVISVIRMLPQTIHSSIEMHKICETKWHSMSHAVRLLACRTAKPQITCTL